MSPADIAAAPAFHAGLYRRLAELGLVPPEQADIRLAARPDSPAPPAGEEERKAA